RLAELWLGAEMPDWSAPCPIRVQVGSHLGAGGATSFVFHGGEVYGWEMTIQGSAERIIDSVLPHEVTHMILATKFRRPIPRWLDEGAATSVEFDSEKENYRRLLRDFLREDVKKGIPFNQMVAFSEYPSDVMPFYAQGFSVAEYLIQLAGHRRFVEFAEAAMDSGNWNDAVRIYYGFDGLGGLQIEWVNWVAAGSPLTPSVPFSASGEFAKISIPSVIELARADVSDKYADSQTSSFLEASDVIPIPNQMPVSSSQVIQIPASYSSPIMIDAAKLPIYR
ncbi:MAG: peptidase MA family metallohydrolase, partial [Thermoguttaceae bacterium]